MRILVTAVIVIVNFILQSTLFQYIEIMGIKPNTAIIIIVAFSFMRGEMSGAMLGLLIGLLQDMFFGTYIGINAILYMLTGLLCGKFFVDYYKENYLLVLVLTVVSTIFYEFLFFVTNILLRGYTDFAYYFNKIILPETVYTAFFAIFIYRLLFVINRQLEKRENLKRKFF